MLAGRAKNRPKYCQIAEISKTLIYEIVITENDHANKLMTSFTVCDFAHVKTAEWSLTQGGRTHFG